jgi:hypothetical protein
VHQRMGSSVSIREIALLDSARHVSSVAVKPSMVYK